MWLWLCLWHAYVDPWDMVNKFCFHVYAQKRVFVIMSHFGCHISPFTCHMLYVKCLCWSFGHAEQLLFSCLCWKVSTVVWSSLGHPLGSTQKVPCRRQCLTGGPFIHSKLAKWEQPKGALQAKVPYRGGALQGHDHCICNYTRGFFDRSIFVEAN